MTELLDDKTGSCILHSFFLSGFTLSLVLAEMTLLNILFDLNLTFGVGSNPAAQRLGGPVAMIGIALFFGGAAWIIDIIQAIKRKRQRRMQ